MSTFSVNAIRNRVVAQPPGDSSGGSKRVKVLKKEAGRSDSGKAAGKSSSKAVAVKPALNTISESLIRYIFFYTPVEAAEVLPHVCKGFKQLINKDFWRQVVGRDYSVTKEQCKKQELSCRRAFMMLSPLNLRAFFDTKQPVHVQCTIEYPLGHKPKTLRMWGDEICFSQGRRFTRLFEEPSQDSFNFRKVYLPEENDQDATILCQDVYKSSVALGLENNTVWIQTSDLKEYVLHLEDFSTISAIKLDNEQVFVGHIDGLVSIFQSFEKKPSSKFTSHSSSVTCFHISGGLLYSGSRQNGVYSYDLQKASVHFPVTDEVTAIRTTSHSIHPRVCCATSAGDIFVFNKDGTSLGKLPAGDELTRGFASAVNTPHFINAIEIQGDVLVAVTSHYITTFAGNRTFLAGSLLFWDLSSQKLMSSHVLKNECFDMRWAGQKLLMTHYGQYEQGLDGYASVGIFQNALSFCNILKCLEPNESQSQSQSQTATGSLSLV